MSVILETKRLILRESVVADAPDLFEMNSDPEVLKYTGDAAFRSVEETEELIRNYKDYKKHGYGRWTTIVKATNEVIGFCGLKYLEDIDETDLGYRWKKQHWGKGYATEAGRACLQYGFETLGVEQIVAQVLKDNGASIRVLEKLGMKYWKVLDTEENPGLFYRILKEDFN
ncbi:MAG TPA: GNAT family N-acetyltransferase [Flavipsychrobacter sp.]